MDEMARFSFAGFMLLKKNSNWLRALLGMMCWAVVARAGLPYLPIYGPTPLRVAPKPAPPVVAAEKPAAAPTNIPPALVTMPANTNAPTEAVAPPPEMIALPNSPSDDIYKLNAQGMVAITPQMLATYFRPVTVGTNEAVVAGQVPIGFVPPFTHPDSRAEYIVK